MASIGAIFTSTYHTKQLNPWPNSSASRMVNYSRLSACQGDMEPFEGDLSTRGRLTSLRNKPQQKQPRQLSASIHAWIVSQCIQLSFDGEKCVLLLCAWKASFLKSGHNYVFIFFIMLHCILQYEQHWYKNLSMHTLIYSIRVYLQLCTMSILNVLLESIDLNSLHWAGYLLCLLRKY